MDNNLLAQMMEQFDRDTGLFFDFKHKLEGLLQELLKQKGIRVHSITARVKERVSLQGKIGRHVGKYTELDQITDLVGIRIITYYADEVDAIANIVEEEFEVDRENSVDKRELLDPDQFGYLSMHYVVQLPQKRLELTEYARFKDCKAEIQIRSILQHTWAEIEHDLGYKSKQAIPKDIRRNFSRLAGLLEIADLEFAKIRESLAEYESGVTEQIQDAPAQVLIDQASLKSYIANSEIVQRLDRQIAELAKAQRFISSEDEIGDRVKRLNYLGFKTIYDVDAALKQYEDMLIEYARQVFLHQRALIVVEGVSLFYLCLILVAKEGSLQGVLRFLRDTESNMGVSQERLAAEILNFYKQTVVRLHEKW